MATAKRWRIENGPSEMDLFVLGLARRQIVEFEYEQPGGRNLTFSAIIDGIEASDGSCKNWNVKGWVREAGQKFGKFKMFFSYQKNRTGWVEFIDN